MATRQADGAALPLSDPAGVHWNSVAMPLPSAGEGRAAAAGLHEWRQRSQGPRHCSQCAPSHVQRANAVAVALGCAAGARAAFDCAGGARAALDRSSSRGAGRQQCSSPAKAADVTALRRCPLASRQGSSGGRQCGSGRGIAGPSPLTGFLVLLCAPRVAQGAEAVREEGRLRDALPHKGQVLVCSSSGACVLTALSCVRCRKAQLLLVYFQGDSCMTIEDSTVKQLSVPVRINAGTAQ